MVQDFKNSKSANHFNRINKTKQVLKQILKQDNQIKIVQRDERISLKLKSDVFKKLFEQYTTNHKKQNKTEELTSEYVMSKWFIRMY